MKGLLGYGRYNDAPAYVGCPRAKSDMTPCIARDGNLALADAGDCVFCYKKPHEALMELVTAMDKDQAADALTAVVRLVTEPKES